MENSNQKAQISKINFLNPISSRLETVEERIRELEEKAIKMFYYEEQREKRKKN
jgi:hypothetical protein